MKLRVAVIYGGRSGEHEISMRSAESVMSAMDPRKYKILRFFITKEGRWRPKPIMPEPNGNPEIDVVFPVLHGTFGEDGTMQGVLEMADLPYVGAGVLASAAAMDKEVAKRLCVEHGLPIVDYLVLRAGELDPDRVEAKFGYPVFVKPANLGSSVGITKAHDRAELQTALSLACQFDRKVIVERAVEGRELECSVLGNDDAQASIPCEIIPSREFYDYEDKYILDRAETRLPAELSQADTDRVRKLAVAAFRALDCEGMARVDFLREESTGQIYINEINTIPGFTSISMYPKMWDYSGIPYPELIDRLIHLALERHQAKRRLRYTR